MAFCDKCGAYIPDGQTECLACGYDEAENERIERQQAAQAAAAAAEQEKKSSRQADTGKYYSFSNEELREKLEEQRKKQQEASRKWAEQEKARRDAAGENYEVRQGETFHSTGEKAQKAARSFAKNSKLLSALSYLGILFVLPFLINKDDSFSVFHAKQGAVLFLYGIISKLLRFIPLLGPVLRLFYFYCIYKGMYNAANDIKQPLPYIGQLGEKF